jgi:spore cortex formation protein SpoVR/YcgB (stage V sporulation)
MQKSMLGNLIQTVYVGSSIDLSTLYTDVQLAEIVNSVESEIAAFVALNSGLQSIHIVTFCKEIASIFKKNCIVSHFLEVDDNALIVYIDFATDDIKSRFIYTPHYIKAH